MSKEMLFLCDVYDAWLSKNKVPHRCASQILYGADTMDKLTVTVPFTVDELYETIKLYDILRDMDFELSETQVEVFEKLQDAEVNGGFF